MASMVPYRSVFGVRPSASSLFDLFDDMTDLANNSIASKAFPVDVEDKGDGYEVKAYLTGVAKDDIDVELKRRSVYVNVRGRRGGTRARTSCRRSSARTARRVACI